MLVAEATTYEHGSVRHSSAYTDPCLCLQIDPADGELRAKLASAAKGLYAAMQHWLPERAEVVSGMLQVATAAFGSWNACLDG